MIFLLVFKLQGFWFLLEDFLKIIFWHGEIFAGIFLNK
jgi:hypothetical protein